MKKEYQTVVPAKEGWYVVEPHGKDLDMNPVIAWLIEHELNDEEPFAFCRAVTIEGLASYGSVLQRPDGCFFNLDGEEYRGRDAVIEYYNTRT